MFNKELRMCRKCERIVPEEKMYQQEKFNGWEGFRTVTTKVCQKCVDEVSKEAASQASFEAIHKLLQSVEVVVSNLPTGKVTNPVPKPKK
jgi:hypothetical protein